MEEFRCDPLEWFSKDIFGKVLSLLDAASLARCISVCSQWKFVAGSDILWKNHCVQLWKDKFIMRTRSVHQIKPSNRSLYCLSLKEGHRTRITIDDLCSYSWYFWYKMEAGNYWMDCDPYWRGLHPMRRYFHKDGYVSADPNDPLWGGHECRWNFTQMPGCTPQVREKQEEKSPSRVCEKQEEKSRSRVCVRINKWPPLKVSRTSCWGWRLENFMVVYQTSHPNECCRPGATVGGEYCIKI